MDMNEPVLLKPLDWDSDLLGMDAALIDLTRIIPEMDEEELFDRIGALIEAKPRASFITIKLHSGYSGLLRHLQKSGARLIDTELVFGRQGASEGDSPGNVDFVTTCDPEAFLPLAKEMRWSRLFMDRRLPQDRVENLWETSITNHCRGRAHGIAVAKRGERPAGMATIDIVDQAVINLHMVGVLKEFRGEGVGKELMGAIVKHWGPDFSIRVETSSMNTAAQGLYRKSGFRLMGSRYILHLIR